MNPDKPLYIPIILGTARQNRSSEAVANFVLGEVRKREGVDTELIDVRELNFSTQDEGEEIKDQKFSAQMERADGIVIVTPEYNHGYPGLLKHALDTNLKEYVHKAAGVCGVSASTFGGSRAIESLLPVLRELGLVVISSDGNFSNAQDLFHEDGSIKDPAYIGRIDKFLGELIWMAKTLRYGREHIAP